MKRKAIFIITAALLLCGCSKKPDNIFETVQKNLDQTESVTANMKVETNIADAEDEMGVSMDMEVQSMHDPDATYMKGQMDYTFADSDIATEMEIYHIEEDGKPVSYTYMEEQWIRSESDTTDILAPDMYKTLAENADTFTLSEETTEVEKKECLHMEGELDGKHLGEILDAQMLQSLGMDDVLNEEVLEGIDLPCTVDVYEEEMLPAKLTIDLKDALTMLYGSEDVTVNQYQVEITYTSFNDVEAIQLPDEAVEQAIEDEDESDGAASGQNAAEQKEALGDTWDSYTVQINEEIITLPCQMSDLDNAGIYPDEEDMDVDAGISAGEYEIAYCQDVEGNHIMVYAMNTTNKEIALKDCLVGGIIVEDYDLENGGLTLTFPGGIEIGSSQEDVVKAYGEAQDVYEEEDGAATYTWYEGDSETRCCQIYFDGETKLATSITLECYD